MIIRLTRNAVNTLDRVYTDRSIYDNYGHFTEWFLKWNYIFHQYVRESVLSTITKQYGMFSIGTIGSLAYLKYNILGSEVFVIRNFYFPTFRFTSSSTPTVDVAKSPRNIWTPPKGKSFVVAPKMKVLKGEYYNGMKIGYYNRRYTILNADGKPITNKWFDKRPRFFNKPFGQYRVIAHVNYRGSLFAVSVDGQLYNMNKLWDDAYLKEIYEAIIKSLIAETINSYLKSNLLLAS